MNNYPTNPENAKEVSVTTTGRVIQNCPGGTTGTVQVKVTSSLAFTVQGLITPKDSTTSTDWSNIGVTKQDGTTVAAGVTITPTAGDVYTFDLSRCTQYCINVSAGTGTVAMMSKGFGGSGGGSGSGSGTSASYAVQNVGVTAVSSGAGLSYASETLASGNQGTAFSSVSGFVPYPTRGCVFVSNPNTNCNLYLRPCPVGAGSTVSATAFLWIVPPLRSYLLPLGNALDLRWFSDISTGSATAVFAEAY